MTECGEDSVAHCSVHVAPVAHDIEHEPVHLTWHVEPLAQVMLPLSPIVTLQSASAVQLMLHE